VYHPARLRVLAACIRVTGTVYSIKTEADARHTTVSELTRAALRSYLAPRATGTLAVSSVYRLQVSTQVPVWTGGFNDRRLDVRPDLPQPLAGNVEPTRQ